MRNILGVTEYQSKTFQFMKQQPMTLLYGDLAPQKDTSATKQDVNSMTTFFYSKETDCSKQKMAANTMGVSA